LVHHTFKATAMATSRGLVAVLESYQRAGRHRRRAGGPPAVHRRARRHPGVLVGLTRPAARERGSACSAPLPSLEPVPMIRAPLRGTEGLRS